MQTGTCPGQYTAGAHSAACTGPPITLAARSNIFRITYVSQPLWETRVAPARYADCGALLLSVATKVGKSACRAAPPDAAHRVPCVSRRDWFDWLKGPVPNSLPGGRSDMRNRTSPLSAAILGVADGPGRRSGLGGFVQVRTPSPESTRLLPGSSRGAQASPDEGPPHV